MSGNAPRRHFTLTLEPDIAQQISMYTRQHGFVSESQAVNALLRIHLSATPEQGMITADRVRAFNEVRVWTITHVNRALTEIRGLLEASARE